MPSFDELVSGRADHLREIVRLKADASADQHPELWQGKMSRAEYVAAYMIGFLAANVAAYQIEKEAAR